jgi:replicative DNA helicase
VSAIERVIATLPSARRSGSGWKARCPGHDDQKASLSLRESGEGHVLLRCFGGCNLDAILMPLGLQPRDLFEPSTSSRDAGVRSSAITLAEFAADKRLPIGFLQERGLHDLPGGGVGIPYPDMVGEFVQVKRRMALKAKEGSYWPKGARLMPYGLDRLADARSAGYLITPEGETETLTGQFHGFPMLGIPGATSASVLELVHLIGIDRLYVVREPDQGGPAFVAGMAARLKAIGWEGATWVVVLPVKDVNDLHKLDPKNFAAAFQAALDAATPIAIDIPVQSVSTVESDLEPWLPPTPFTVVSVPTFPLDALPRWLAAYVGAVARSTQTPVSLAALLALAVVATTSARRVVLHIWDDWTEPINIFVLVVLPPANRRSAVFSEMVAPLLAFEVEAAKKLAPEIKAAETARRIVEQALKKAEDAAARAESAERTNLQNKAEVLASELAGMPSPLSPRLMVDDCTPERLASLMYLHAGRMSVMSPEGGVFEVMSGRYSASGTPNIDIFLKGHAGDAVLTDRVGRPPERIERPALTVAVTPQPVVLRGLMARPGFRGRGLLARWIFDVPASLVGRREIRPPGVPTPLRAEYQQRITDLLEQWPTDEDEPMALTLSPGASDLLEAFATKTEPRLGESGDLGHIADWGGKLVGLVARLASNLHLAAHAGDPELMSEEIEAMTMAAAIKIGEYAVAHALAAFADMGADPEVEDARQVWAWIERQSGESLTKRQIFEGIKGRFHRVEMLESPLKVLEEFGYLRPVTAVKRTGPGRLPSPVFKVNPLGRSHSSQNPRDATEGADLAKSASSANHQAPEREVLEL